ncbi:MAG: hypothetical protein JKY65_21765 [Planctomycetes bacterium]|nr:hypothetical protein [Planctomycetota bacterium]
MAKRRSRDDDYDDDDGYDDDDDDYDDDYASSGPSNNKGVIIGISVVGLLVVLVTGSMVFAAMKKARKRASSTYCANNMRQLGLGAIQYGDDKRFLPHVGPTKDLDGKADTDHASRAFATQFYYGYNDNPESMICPSSNDAAVPGRVPDSLRDWTWGGQKNPEPKVAPLIARAPMPTLVENFELSYAWTRRGYNRNMRSTSILAAGKVANDHGEPGRNVLNADATVRYVSEASPIRTELSSVERGGGYLPLVD